MPEAYIVKTEGGDIIPADDESWEKMKTMKRGVVMKIRYSVARDYQYHRKYFDFLNATFGMQEHFETMEHYRKWITMKAGWYDTIVTPKGDTIFAAKSISFDKMEEDEFHKLFSTCIDVFLQELGTNLTREDVLRVVDYS